MLTVAVGVDSLSVVRELVGGVYFGSPRFIEDLPGGGKRAVYGPRTALLRRGLLRVPRVLAQRPGRGARLFLRAGGELEHRG